MYRVQRIKSWPCCENISSIKQMWRVASVPGARIVSLSPPCPQATCMNFVSFLFRPVKAQRQAQTRWRQRPLQAGLWRCTGRSNFLTNLLTKVSYTLTNQKNLTNLSFSPTYWSFPVYMPDLISPAISEKIGGNWHRRIWTPAARSPFGLARAWLL